MFGRKKVRYAVVGAGWFGQAAVLPGFANSKSSQLQAIVSGDATKQKELGDKYGVSTFTYDQYDGLMASGDIDAVYIVLPNSMHREYTIRAAKHNVHVLCEKPLAANAQECRDMLAACRAGGVQLMTAYRLHFESANLSVVERIASGDIGEPRLFVGINCQMIEDEDNSRLDGDLKGGPLMDLGVYCINAARYTFKAEPVEVFGFTASQPGKKFAEVPEMVTAMLRFPENRLATFSCGFGEAKVSEYRVIGTAGDLRLDPAYSFQSDIELLLTGKDGRETRQTFRERDQVGAEIEYFSDCILEGSEVEPDGREGLIDMIIIDAIKESIKSGQAVSVGPFEAKPRPDKDQEMKMPKVRTPKLVESKPPAGG